MRHAIQLPKLTRDQVSNILDRIVPMIAKPEDHEFFRGVLSVKLENENSATAAAFVAKLLKTWAK
jgi:hypothetical protein